MRRKSNIWQIQLLMRPSKINQVRNISYFLTQRTDFFIFLNQLKQYHVGHFSFDVCTALCCWCLWARWVTQMWKFVFWLSVRTWTQTFFKIREKTWLLFRNLHCGWIINFQQYVWAVKENMLRENFLCYISITRFCFVLSKQRALLQCMYVSLVDVMVLCTYQ